MRKSIFSILLCFIMAVGMFPTAAVAETAPEFKAEDLKSINIPDTLVTVNCTATGDSKTYGAIDGGFDTDNATPYLDSEDNVYKVVVFLKLSAYKNQYDADTGAEHVVSGIGSTVFTFTLKYVDSAWMIEGNFPSVPIFVTCGGHATLDPPTDGGHENQQPEMPIYPTNDNISGLGDNIVAVLCTNVQGGQQSGKYYGLIDGGFTFTEPKLNDDVYESTITLIPSVYCKQYSADTGIMHTGNPNQTTEGLSFVVRYDPEKKMWMPKEKVKQMGIWVICDKHEGGNGGTTDPGTTPYDNTGPGGSTDPGTTPDDNTGPGGSTDPDTTPGGNDGNTKPDNKPGDNGNNQGSDKSGTDPVDNAPQTEDISNMSLWLAIMLLNIGALLGTVVFIRKHKRV